VIEEPKWWRWFAMLILVVGVVIRAWPWLSAPLLFFEDGAVFFSANYSQFELSGLAKPYAGYVPFGANLCSLLLCRLPTACIPTAFVVVAAAVQLAAGCSLLGRSWRAVAPFWVCGLLAALIVLLPIASHLEFTTLAYMQWPMLCWLFLLLVEPQPATEVGGLRCCLRSALVVFLTISHPLAVVLAPLAMLRAVRVAQRLRWVAYAASLVGFAIIRWLLIDGHGAPELAISFVRMIECVPALLIRVGLESLVGFDGWQWLLGCGTVIAFGAAVLCWITLAMLVRLAVRQWGGATRTFACACGWLLFAPLAASLLVRDICWDDPWIVRYLWLSRVAFLLVATICVTTLLPRWLVAALVIVLATVLTNGNARFHRHATGAAELRQFVGRLYAQEQRDGHRRLIDERFVRDQQPPIMIRSH
jgi:hypothetical protein